MHVTMLRLSFAYAIFTAPLMPAHFFDNTSDNSLRMTPFRVRFLKNIQTPPSPPPHTKTSVPKSESPSSQTQPFFVKARTGKADVLGGFLFGPEICG